MQYICQALNTPIASAKIIPTLDIYYPGIDNAYMLLMYQEIAVCFLDSV